MFRYLLVCALVACHCMADGQLLEIATPVKLLALGDSYTIGESVADGQSWPVQLKDSLEAHGFQTDTLKVIATSGWRTDQLLEHIRKEPSLKDRYNLVGLLIGVNNQFQGKSINEYQVEFKKLLDTAIALAGNDTSHVFVLSIPDYAATPYGRQHNPQGISIEIDRFNKVNKKITKDYGIAYFDITPISRQGVTDPTLVADDGLHPSGSQYSLWVHQLMEAIRSSIVDIDESAGIDVMQIYPNPATDSVFIRLPAGSLLYTRAQITDADGNIKGVHPFDKTGRCAIDLKLYAPGTYQVLIFDKELPIFRGNFIREALPDKSR